MLKKLFSCLTAAGAVLSVLLCGCGEENGGEIILIGDAVYSSDAAPETPQAEAGTPVAAETPRAGAGAPVAAETSQTEAGAPVSQAETAETVIRVYVCGAVACPGVVEIPQGSRVEDALYAAGGFLPEARAEAVNLADWVSDGQMLYFPTDEETQAWSPVQEGQSAQDEQGRLVNINTADAALLCTLPGIGGAKAADIIAYREAHGGFASCEDIMKVPGIKTNIYEKICDKITVQR